MGGLVHRAAVGAVLALAVALGCAGAAQAAWSGIDALGTARYGHTATPLPDGRVLVAGGNDSGPLGSAELYDPAAHRWSNAHSMNVARHGHAAVLMRSGKILVAGGSAPADPASNASGYTRTAEIYDPAANTWTEAASMSTGRFQPTMTALPDGRVLVAGGSGDIETPDGVRAAVPLASAEVYDPANDSWTDVPSMSVPRALATATPIENGKVLVAGGYDDATGELSSAELYDPSTDRWSKTGSLAEARDAATATALPNGEVLVAGGDSGDGALASAELYRPASGTWRAAARMAGVRQTAAAALLSDGTVLVAGGEDARFGDLLDTTERYDPAADRWTDGARMAAARTRHTLTALDGGRALAVGGNPGGFASGLGSVDRFSQVATTVTAAGFGIRPIGIWSGVQTSVLTNAGSAPLLVSGVSIAGANAEDFEVASEACQASPIAPGETCRIDLRFMPTAAGARSATLTVADNTAAGTSTAALSGTGVGPTPAPTTPGGDAPTRPSAATGAAGPGGVAGAGRRGVAGTSARSPRRAARASCKVKTTRSHGQSRSIVTCRVTWPTRRATALRARLMRGTSVLASARWTARARSATVRLRPARRLHRGRYTVVIARRDRTVVLRRSIRVS
jgi:N-acetylneuraminic acid mutarotase